MLRMVNMNLQIIKMKYIEKLKKGVQTYKSLYNNKVTHLN